MLVLELPIRVKISIDYTASSQEKKILLAPLENCWALGYYFWLRLLFVVILQNPHSLAGEVNSGD